MGIADFCRFDISVVRGLAYYTGVVFEIYDKVGELRAIGGGGRYDNLLKQLGGPNIPATGCGIGDCVLGILLEEKGLLKPPKQQLDYFLAFADEQFSRNAIEITVKLRRLDFACDFSYKFTSLGKQLKQASDKNAKMCVIIGDEFKNNQLVIKNMTTGKQELVEVDKFFANLKTGAK